jgi:hypothetical protein
MVLLYFQVKWSIKVVGKMVISDSINRIFFNSSGGRQFLAGYS